MLPEELARLVQLFSDNLASYHSPSYNETELRRNFLDKLIRLLGWDVDNANGYSEEFKEVIHEDRVRVDGSSRNPDYCIQYGRNNKLFYIEAKKTSVNIKNSAEAAFQIRSYGWSAKMPICLLSKFEEFAVYDTTFQLRHSDQAASARLFYCRYDELAVNGNWETVYGYFSKEVVLKGALECLGKRERPGGTVDVDEVFLKDIECWRENLGRRPVNC